MLDISGLEGGKFWRKRDWKVSKSFPVSATLLQQLFNNKLCIWSKSFKCWWVGGSRTPDHL